MIAANTVIGGRYRVIKPLGGGGMKLVYLAEDLRLASRPCALAEMVDSFTSPDMQRQAVAAFQREADMLATLNNEHIPRVFDRFSEENRHYLVLEYIDGITLEQRLREAGGKLGESEVIEIALQVLDTLEYLHNLSPPVIYRDLKPSNVMVTRSGLAKLIDFGIARHFRPQQSATMIGTQGYAPPEQYRGKVEARSDLYALGATMHHALSGRDPAAEAPFSFPPLASLCPGMTPALADLIDQTLQYDVALRVRDATEFKDRLVAIQSGAVPVTVAPPISTGPSSAQRASRALGSQRGNGRSQLRLPLGHGSQAQSSSAPTVLTSVEEFPCDHCGRLIPADSRFCSFCAAPIRVVLGAQHVAPEADTSDLSRFDFTRPPGDTELSPRREVRERLRRHGLFGVLALLFGIAFIVTTIVSYVASHSAANAPDNYPVPPPIMPGETEPNVNPAPPPGSGGGSSSVSPERAARLYAFREALNMQGYTNVHFKIDGDTMVLWGTVPSLDDKTWVEELVPTIAGMYSTVDHLSVRDTFAAP